MSFEINIFVNKIQRMPLSKVQEMLKMYDEEIENLPFLDANAILNFVEKRFSLYERIPRNEIIFQRMLFSDLAFENRGFGNTEIEESAKNELKSLDLIALIESLQYMEVDCIKEVLRKHHNLLEPKIVETIIINLPEEEQISAIEICRQELMNSEPNTFYNFMASVGKDTQKYILESFEEKFESYSSEDMSNVAMSLYQDNIDFYTQKYARNIGNDEDCYKVIMSCSDENLEETVNRFKDQIQNIDANSLMKMFCLKTNNSELLYKIWSGLGEKLSEVSIPYFKTFIRRLEDKERIDSIYKLKEKFSTMDLNEIVELFEYDSDEVKATVLLEYRDRFSGEKSQTLEKFMSKSVKSKMIELYANQKLEEFEELRSQGVDLKQEFEKTVLDLKDDKSHKLFDDDYIKAILLSRVLMKNNEINDKNESYVNLRTKYMNHLFKNLRRDNTVDDNISNSLFYRIVKGNISFNTINDLETAKALIYLSRNPQEKDVEKVENIVKDVTEKQVQTYNLKLYKKLCSKIKERYNQTNPLDENVQKLAYKMFFLCGYDKALKMLDSETSFTTFEYMFNDLKLRSINMNADGTPKTNEKLSNFLFGGSGNFANSNINRMLNGEIPEFDKYLSTICNDWDLIYKKLNGNISVKRVLDLFKNQTIFLKPDEYKLEEVLRDIGTKKPEIIQKAKDWYSTMRQRQYSTIPKVQGKIDNYEYEMLDLDNPLALSVGYLTRCCFLIDGLSRQSLYHSISSKNGRTFVVRKDGELIAQSWTWRNGNVLCFDNVETRGSYSYDKLLEVYQKASEHILDVSQNSENDIESLKLVTYGTSESKMTEAEEKLSMNPLPTMLENVNYSDAKYEQAILAQKNYSDLYFGEVVARYEDPRPNILEYRDISSLNDKEIEKINTELDSIEYSKTGNTRKNNVRKCKYIAYNKDWYIAINNDGDVEIQILQKDKRATEECKAKTKEILEEIKSDKIVIPIDFDDVGGDVR